MFCAMCGTQVPDDAVICPNCQSRTGIEELNFQQNNYEEQQVEENMNVHMDNSDFSNPYYQNPFQKEEPTIKNVRELFIREDEEEKAVIGGGYLSNLLHTGVLYNGFGVLTNRRFYFKGKCYHRNGKGLTKTDEERIVDLQDISSSGFTYSRSVLWFALSLFGSVWAVLATVMSLSEGTSDDVISFMIVFGWFPSIMFWVIYILSKVVIYEVSFAGGTIAVKASAYGKKELRDFDRKLRLEKDEFLETK